MYDTRNSRSLNARRWREIDRNARATLTDYESQQIAMGKGSTKRRDDKTQQFGGVDKELEEKMKLLTEMEKIKPAEDAVKFTSERV